MKTLIIIPTYNERQNIGNLIQAIFELGIEGVQVLVVDDNSPDGTAEVVKELQKSQPKLHLIQRERKMGLGTAYVAGFRFALKHSFELIMEIDADFSHDPKDILRFMIASETSDLVVGSRYVNGVNVINWPLGRLLMSIGASTYTRLITGLPLKDCTSGFKCFRREVLESIALDRLQSDGYSFQIEMNFRAWKKGFRISELPIVFVDRRAGTSKMSKKIVREAIWMVWKLKLMSLLGRLG
ncbi:dolichyl-phosphate beta-D-mannosyltransferase [candidate division KSB1 bacterium RBG_16_48_16]|nr:MAG: dolichyl-phosphate beta-D-mannosyltransferase [candidate division KSB1 bacterium RBG_16_48_16]